MRTSIGTNGEMPKGGCIGSDYLRMTKDLGDPRIAAAYWLLQKHGIGPCSVPAEGPFIEGPAFTPAKSRACEIGKRCLYCVFDRKPIEEEWDEAINVK